MTFQQDRGVRIKWNLQGIFPVSAHATSRRTTQGSPNNYIVNNKECLFLRVPLDWILFKRDEFTSLFLPDKSYLPDKNSWYERGTVLFVCWRPLAHFRILFNKLSNTQRVLMIFSHYVSCRFWFHDLVSDHGKCIAIPRNSYSFSVLKAKSDTSSLTSLVASAPW